MVRESDCDKLYHVAASISANKTTAEASWPLFEECSRSEMKAARMLTVNMLFRYFDDFKKQHEIQEKVYGMLTDPEQEVRRLIIHSLPKFIRRGQNVTPVSDVLAQLLVTKDPIELVQVKKSLGQVLSDYPGQCFTAMHACAMQSDTIHEKLKIAEYLEERFPECGRDLTHITDLFAILYNKIIAEVELEEDMRLLISCLKSNNFVRYAVIINAFTKRVGNSNIDLSEFIGFIGSRLESDSVRLNTLDVSMARANFVIAVFNRATIENFEESYRQIVEKGFLKPTEVHEISERIIDATFQEGFDNEPDVDKLLFRLFKVFIMGKNLPDPETRLTPLKWMRRNIELTAHMTPRQRRNFFVLLASFSAKDRSLTKREGVVRYIMRFVFEIMPDLEHEDEIVYEMHDLETACFLIKNVIKPSAGMYNLLARIEPNWKERFAEIMEMLRQTTQTINDEMRVTPESEYRSSLSRKLHLLNQCGICIYLFVGNRFRDTLRIFPTWVSAERIFKKRLTQVLLGDHYITVFMDVVLRNSRPSLPL